MKTFIWDLDGTLVDSYEIITRNVHQVVKEHLNLSQEDIFKRITDASISGFFREEAKKNNLSLEALYNAYMSVDDGVVSSEYHLIRGCKDILELLQQQGHQHFIYTHRGLATLEIIKANDIDHYFIEVVTSDNGFRRKPESEALDYLIEKYDLDKSNTYYVGDRSLDVECGNIAGIKTIYFNEQGKSNYKADYSIQSLKDIIKFI
ncbi:MAG: HAD-IA family hydrolase [Clostridiales bacterium]|nr:HAD-IA family hydrolase [Clostridiales bacterium]